MKVYWIFVGLSFWGLRTFGQLNVQLLHQLVAESKSEYSRQEDARKRQATVSANEVSNRSETSKLKANYREIKSRFHSVGTMISAVRIGTDAIPIINDIVGQQQRIVSLAASDPVLIAIAYETQEALVERSYRLSNYLYGLVLSAGDLNQMKASDRSILFNYVITELRQIAGTSRGLAQSMYNASISPGKLNPFTEYINRDKQLVEDILQNASILKN